ncbi:MAG: hypothetical protein ACI9JL_001462 [Paracoccaceae bacterium]
MGSLPSPAGKTISAIRAMAPGTWLDLGAPRPDPKWGRARGRAWTSKMAFSSALGGAFLFGEGEHGWVNPSNGRYMDGLWLYDVNGHRWVALYPGTDTRSPPDLRVTRDGFEGVGPDSPVPVATMVHGYEMTAWDPVRQIFFSMPNHHPYFTRPLPSVAKFRQQNAGQLNKSAASPWMFDPWNRRWHRLRTATASPKSTYGNVLMFVPSQKKLFFYRSHQAFYYDPQNNSWRQVGARGPLPPFGIDPTACHHSKRDRIFIGGGNYPVAKGRNALWAFDVKSNRWVDPKPEGSPAANHYGTNTAVMTCDPQTDRVHLFRHSGKQRGLYVYDVKRNAWRDRAVPLPDFWRMRTVANGFYHPELGVHFIHTANDSRDNGNIIVYRPDK